MEGNDLEVTEMNDLVVMKMNDLAVMEMKGERLLMHEISSPIKTGLY